MKKFTTIITVFLMLASVLGGCKKATPTPSMSPNVPEVSESPAIPSPEISPSATVTPNTGTSPLPTVSPSPGATT
ncbi:MAG: hypothetical protein GX488_07650 [Clostridiales bacterium]|nr:hypothetical protein [Clostridiales bacterium]